MSDSPMERAVRALGQAEQAHVAKWGTVLCPDPYCRVCRDEDGEVRDWLETLWSLGVSASVRCVSTWTGYADGDTVTLRCQLRKGHPGEHRNVREGRGGGLPGSITWPDSLTLAEEAAATAVRYSHFLVSEGHAVLGGRVVELEQAGFVAGHQFWNDLHPRAIESYAAIEVYRVKPERSTGEGGEDAS